MKKIKPTWKSISNIRKEYVNYFRNQHNHGLVPSASLVPHNDPTLLFTNAGMVQFKDIILGHSEPPNRNPRAVSVQRCVRAGGKHNDLENVGMTPRHHTFFEMLGNFSFGDYFKEEAIVMAWDFVTNSEYLGLPNKDLRITVHHCDSESKEIWRKISGLPHERIVTLGDADNFWSMGDTGPCGPCTEIFFDRGSEFSNEDDRWLEIWNLVFMEFNRSATGDKTPLPFKCVDTGMGLERIASILQNVNSNYDTDEFINIMHTIEMFITERVGKKLQRLHLAHPPHTSDECGMRVIADHLRASAHLIADGVVPSNVGRGYVLRRIIRRASRYCNSLGVKEPVLGDLIKLISVHFDSAYSNVPDVIDSIENILRNEETAFFDTLSRGLLLLEQELLHVSPTTSKIDGEFVFRLYDTHGFPADITNIVAKENGLDVDMKRFDELMEEQRERNRTNWKLVSGDLNAKNKANSRFNIPPPVVVNWQRNKDSPVNYGFVGYDSTNLELVTSVDKIHWLDCSDNEVNQNGDLEVQAWVALEACPFYPEGGGQVSDRGELRVLSGVLEDIVFDVIHVITTKTGDNGSNDIAILIKYTCSSTEDIESVKSNFAIGTTVFANVLKDWRKSNETHHTATHVLQAGLRNMLGTQIMQAGSLVDPQRLRFDFTHGLPLSNDEILILEDYVNTVANMDSNVLVDTDVPINEAKENGAIAMFGEKYGETVRVVNIPNISMELCGGTHVNSTASLRPFKIISEVSVAAGVRRIEAVAGNAAVEWYKKREEEGLKMLGSLVLPHGNNSNNNPTLIYERVVKIIEENEQMKQTINSMKQEMLSGKISSNSSSKSPNNNEDVVTNRNKTEVFTINKIGSNIRIAEKTVVLHFLTLPGVLKPENATDKKDRKRLQQDCVKSLREKLDEVKYENPNDAHIVCDGLRIAIWWGQDKGKANKDIKYAHQFLHSFFEVKLGRGGGTANFAQGQFFNDITFNEVLGCIGVNTMHRP
eukprot:g9605.t1